MAGCCTYKVVGITLILTGAVLFIFAFILGFAIVPSIAGKKVDETIVPGTDAEGLADFAEASEAPFYNSYHLFNLTNAEAWLAGAEKPAVQDLGSYTFVLNETKIDPQPEPDGCSITYTHNRTYWHVPEESTIEDTNAMIYGLNPLLLGTAALFNGLIPAVEAGILPSVLTTVVGKLVGLTMPTSGLSLTAEMLSAQMSTLSITRLMSAAQTFADTPGLAAMLAALPAETSQAILEQLGAPLPATFVLEPAAFFRDYPGKNISVRIGEDEKVVRLPSSQEIWPEFAGFTAEEGALFLSYLNGTTVTMPSIGDAALSTLLVIATQGLVGEGIADEFVLMALNETDRQARLPALVGLLYSAINLTSAPCQGNQSEVCEPYATMLNVDSVDSLSKLWMLTVLNDYYAAWTQLAIGMLGGMNGGLVIGGTAEQWINGFEAMPGMSIPSIITSGPESGTRTMYTGKCDDLDIGSWEMLDGKKYVDPRLYPYSCPEALTDEEAAANCKALRIEGSDGKQFPRTKKPKWNSKKPRRDEYTVWVTEINRNLPLLYSGDTITIEGITLSHFIIPVDGFNITSYDNAALYDIRCDGLLEGATVLESPSALVPSRKNIIMAVSRPHFLFADPSCTSGLVDGLAPDPELHDIYLDIEPYSGATMNARKRLQVSLLPKKELVGEGYTKAQNLNMTDASVKIWGGAFNDVRYAPIPYYYLEQRSTITPKLAGEFRDKLYKPLKITYGFLIALPIVGGLLAILGAFLVYKSIQMAKEGMGGQSSYMDTQVSVADKKP